MNGTKHLEVEKLISDIRRHPKISYQKIGDSDADRGRLRKTMSPLLAFGDATYAGCLAVLDWDHRIPSKICILRLHAYYSEDTLAEGKKLVDFRANQIVAQDRFPEFDVPDFEGIFADETYEAEMQPDGEISRMRLTSPWRRDIGNTESVLSVQIVRDSSRFKQLLSKTQRDRADILGDLEAVAWTPPCETNLADWTIDVWYLTHLDVAVGRGQSFLVDLNEKKVVGVREFVVRTS